MHEDRINKQLADKERVCAAMENRNLAKMISKGLLDTDDIEEYLHMQF